MEAEFKAFLHKGEKQGGDSHRGRAGLGQAVWSCSPLCAMGTRGEMGFGAGTKVGSAWKKQPHLQQAVDVPSQEEQAGLSDFTVFILILELGCTFYCYRCLSELLRNAHTPQRFRIKWKTE